MIVVLLTGIFAVIMALLRRYGLKQGLKIAFCVICVISAIRCQYGNDYSNYYDYFLSSLGDTLDWGRLYNEREPLWYLFNVVFGTFFGKSGFYWLVAFLAIFQNCLVYRVINSFVEIRVQWFAVFIYMFNTSYWLIDLSMMRQGLVVCIFFSILPWITQRKIIKSLITVFLCSMIHKSAIILFPFLFVGFIPVKSRKLVVLILIVLFGLLLLSQQFLNNLFSSIINLNINFEDYTEIYSKDSYKLTYRLGYVLGLIPAIVTLWNILDKKSIFNLQSRQEDYQRIMRLFIISLFYLVSEIIIQMGQLIPLITRVAIYFSVFQIILIPFLYSHISNRVVKFCLYFIYIFMTTYGYILFFSSSSVYSKPYSTFHTIFEFL